MKNHILFICNSSNNYDLIFSGFKDGLTDISTSFPPISLPIPQTASDCDPILNHEQKNTIQIGEGVKLEDVQPPAMSPLDMVMDETSPSKVIHVFFMQTVNMENG